MQTHKIRLVLAAALAVLALGALAAGCGSDDEGSGASRAAANTTDVAFVNDMTAHHQGAIDMAELARSRAEHPAIKRLAHDIVGAQGSEISVMQAARDDMHDRGEDGDAHMGMDAHAMGMDMDMTGLENAKPFDKAFIDAMVPHHQGAIAMAKALLEKGEHAALRKLADDIISAQTREIAQMRAWREAWYGSATGSGDTNGHTPDDHGSMGMGG